MSSRMPDYFKCNGDLFELLRQDEDWTPLFDIKDFGLTPQMQMSCPKGYQVIFALNDGSLFVEHLRVFGSQTNVSINGVFSTDSPSFEDPNDLFGQIGYLIFDAIYEDVGLFLPFDGGLLIGSSRLGTSPAPVWGYERVIELVFKSGLLKAQEDRSMEMALLREKMLDPNLRTTIEERTLVGITGKKYRI